MLHGAALAALVLMIGSARAGAQAAVAQTSMPALTLTEAVRRTIAASPAIAGAEGGISTARAAERSASGAFLPALSLTGNTVRSNQTLAATAAAGQTAYGVGLASTLELFDGGRRLATRRAATALELAATAGAVSSRYGVVLLAKRAFYDVLRAQALLGVTAARIQQAERSREIARSRRAAGTATRSDELRTELELNNARQAQLSARVDFDAATLALGRLAGLDGPATAQSDSAALAPKPLPLSITMLEDLAASQAPTVVASRERSRAAAAALRAARTQWLPTISAGAGYNAANHVVLPGALRDGWALQLGLAYPIFNNFRRDEAITQAAVADRVAASTAFDAARAARAEAGRLAGAVTLTAERIALAESAVTAAEEDLRVIEARYRIGASAILDLLTSQLNLVQARTGLVNARFDYLLALAGLEAVVGRDL